MLELVETGEGLRFVCTEKGCRLCVAEPSGSSGSDNCVGINVQETNTGG